MGVSRWSKRAEYGSVWAIILKEVVIKLNESMPKKKKNKQKKKEEDEE